MVKKRVTVDFDSESYYLDGKYWESWDNYGEEMADAINELLDKEQQKVKVILRKHYKDLSDMASIKAPKTIIVLLAAELGIDFE